jgi:hypothetical protein
LDQDIQVADNKNISNVTIKKKTEVPKVDEERKDERVEQGLEYLAEHMVESHEQVEPQKPAITPDESELDEYTQAEQAVNEQILAQPSATESQSNQESAPINKKVTKKKS